MGIGGSEHQFERRGFRVGSKDLLELLMNRNKKPERKMK